MGLTYQTVGKAVAHWEEDSPLMWSMKETVGKGDDRRQVTFDFDLTPLEPGYAMDFLLELKNVLISYRKQKALITIETEYRQIRGLLNGVMNKGDGGAKVAQIDEPFLLCLRTIVIDTPRVYLSALKRLYTKNRQSVMFSTRLLPEDFPTRESKKGSKGEQTDRILAQALTRSACAAVLKAVEEAYETGAIDIGHYSFCHLAFHVYCRPESYRRITLADLRIDTDPKTQATSYFLDVLPAKSGVHNPTKINYRLNQTVGELLALQRAAVVERYRHLVESDEISKLALFPARRLKGDNTWVSSSAQQDFGRLATSDAFDRAYMRPIRKRLSGIRLSFNALRHTVGTQLAAAGCSALTIQAVLKHATDSTCQRYVDLAFAGLIDRLSDSLQPGFETHFPTFNTFRSVNDPVAVERAIQSEDIDTGRVELTGECGRMVACQYAPIACYECWRYVPCYDADHSINLNTVEREIRDFEGRGQAFKQLTEKSKHIRRHIQVVMLVCEQKLRALGTN
jgi:integrase